MQRSKSMPNLSYMENSVQKQKQQQKPAYQNELISKTPIRYRHGYTPIKPKRYLVKKSCCYTVLSNVECQIETIKTGSKKDNTMIVNEIYRFRFDEDKIWVYKCKKPVTFNIKMTPHCPLNSPCYSHDSLPAEYWFMYSSACRFMNFVRSKQPMITYYTDAAKAVLFDLPGFFEIVFVADSTRIIYNGDGIHIVKVNGKKNYSFQSSFIFY
jgi:hypothetical protein